MFNEDNQNKISEIASWLLEQGMAKPSLPIFDDNNRECPAYRWNKSKFGSLLIPIWDLPKIELSSLIGIDDAKTKICQNSEHFLKGKPANNVLLTGARGTGKSSLIRAVLNKYFTNNLRIIEVDRESLIDWYQLISVLQKQTNKPQKYILYCDDLSFEKNETAYKALKSILDGGLTSLPSNVLVYATSNRRHLLPESFEDNLSYKTNDQEIHGGDVVEEKISLSDRFGLWISFYAIDQETYLQICYHWLMKYGIEQNKVINARADALHWALYRGGRNGRIAEQFARNYVAKNT